MHPFNCLDCSNSGTVPSDENEGVSHYCHCIYGDLIARSDEEDEDAEHILYPDDIEDDDDDLFFYDDDFE